MRKKENKLEIPPLPAGGLISAKGWENKGLGFYQSGGELSLKGLEGFIEGFRVYGLIGTVSFY